MPRHSDHWPAASTKGGTPPFTDRHGAASSLELLVVACELADNFRCNSSGAVRTTLASVTPSSLAASNWGDTGQSAMPSCLSARGGSCDEAGEGVMYKGGCDAQGVWPGVGRQHQAESPVEEWVEGAADKEGQASGWERPQSGGGRGGASPAAGPPSLPPACSLLTDAHSAPCSPAAAAAAANGQPGPGPPYQPASTDSPVLHWPDHLTRTWAPECPPPSHLLGSFHPLPPHLTACLPPLQPLLMPTEQQVGGVAAPGPVLHALGAAGQPGCGPAPAPSSVPALMTALMLAKAWGDAQLPPHLEAMMKSLLPPNLHATTSHPTAPTLPPLPPSPWFSTHPLNPLGHGPTPFPAADLAAHLLASCAPAPHAPWPYPMLPAAFPPSPMSGHVPLSPHLPSLPVPPLTSSAGSQAPPPTHSSNAGGNPPHPPLAPAASLGLPLAMPLGQQVAPLLPPSPPPALTHLLWAALAGVAAGSAAAQASALLPTHLLPKPSEEQSAYCPGWLGEADGAQGGLGTSGVRGWAQPGQPGSWKRDEGVSCGPGEVEGRQLMSLGSNPGAAGVGSGGHRLPQVDQEGGEGQAGGWAGWDEGRRVLGGGVGLVGRKAVARAGSREGCGAAAEIKGDAAGLWETLDAGRGGSGAAAAAAPPPLSKGKDRSRQGHALSYVVGDGGAGPMAFSLGPDGSQRYRRHKSKVFIRPNKVMYLPTTFMAEAFSLASLPVRCQLLVEGGEPLGRSQDHHQVTIKAVPRQGLSTMYCMTGVCKFQQQYMNWQILSWTKVNEHCIKIRVQPPHPTGFDAAPPSIKKAAASLPPQPLRVDRCSTPPSPPSPPLRHPQLRHALQSRPSPASQAQAEEEPRQPAAAKVLDQEHRAPGRQSAKSTDLLPSTCYPAPPQMPSATTDNGFAPFLLQASGLARALIPAWAIDLAPAPAHPSYPYSPPLAPPPTLLHPLSGSSLLALPTSPPHSSSSSSSLQHGASSGCTASASDPSATHPPPSHPHPHPHHHILGNTAGSGCLAAGGSPSSMACHAGGNDAVCHCQSGSDLDSALVPARHAPHPCTLPCDTCALPPPRPALLLSRGPSYQPVSRLPRHPPSAHSLTSPPAPALGPCPVPGADLTSSTLLSLPPLPLSHIAPSRQQPADGDLGARAAARFAAAAQQAGLPSQDRDGSWAAPASEGKPPVAAAARTAAAAAAAAAIAQAAAATEVPFPVAVTHATAPAPLAAAAAAAAPPPAAVTAADQARGQAATRPRPWLAPCSPSQAKRCKHGLEASAL